MTALPNIGVGSKPVISRKWVGEILGAIVLVSHDFKSVCDRSKNAVPRTSGVICQISIRVSTSANSICGGA
jgi:hypothetical protein